MSELKIQLCCGGNHLEGWQNHDAETDITKPLPFESNSADAMFIEHGAEHVNTHEILRLFTECHRVLKPGSAVRICVPSLEKLTDREHARDLILGHGHQMVFATQSLGDMLWAAGFERDRIIVTKRDPVDSHHKVIGVEKDDLESIRVLAFKL